MPKTRSLIEAFRPATYELTTSADPRTGQRSGKLKIVGQKVGRPSKRITLHQKGIKVSHAELTKIDKKGEAAIAVSRINHHRSFSEVRLHTDEILFPGNYEIKLAFIATEAPDGKNLELALGQLQAGTIPGAARQILPLIDEPGIEASYKIN